MWSMLQSKTHADWNSHIFNTPLIVLYMVNSTWYKSVQNPKYSFNNNEDYFFSASLFFSHDNRITLKRDATRNQVIWIPLTDHTFDNPVWKHKYITNSGLMPLCQTFNDLLSIKFFSCIMKYKQKLYLYVDIV